VDRLPRCGISRPKSGTSLGSATRFAWTHDCHCGLCQELSRFLADRASRTLEWPIAKESRRHIHSAIDDSELPVTHVTRRTGRPYTLVLKKTEALFKQEADERRFLEKTLVVLTR